MSEILSINALANVLERDRAAVTKSLKDVEPDGYQHGQPRWTVATAARALERRRYQPFVRGQTARNSSGAIDAFDLGRPTQLDALRSDYDEGLAAIKEATGRDRKMGLALTLAPTIERYQEVYSRVASTLNVADEVAIESRAALMFAEMMTETERASEWPSYTDERSFGICMRRAMPSFAKYDEGEYDGLDEYGNYIERADNDD